MLEALHIRFQAEVVVDAEDLFLGEPQRLARLVIQVVAIGDDSVDPVVATRQFHDHEDRVFAGGLGGQSRLGQELGHYGSHGEKRGPLKRADEKLASMEHWPSSRMVVAGLPADILASS